MVKNILHLPVVLEDAKLEYFYIWSQANEMPVARGPMSFILKFLWRTSSDLVAVPLRSCLIETFSLIARNNNRSNTFLEVSANENVLEICLLACAFILGAQNTPLEIVVGKPWWKFSLSRTPLKLQVQSSMNVMLRSSSQKLQNKWHWSARHKHSVCLRSNVEIFQFGVF